MIHFIMISKREHLIIVIGEKKYHNLPERSVTIRMVSQDVCTSGRTNFGAISPPEECVWGMLRDDCRPRVHRHHAAHPPKGSRSGTKSKGTHDPK